MSNKQQILISIILPTFNHAKFLKKAVESVVNQSYIHWELIIVDNNSTDNTIDIVKSYSDKRIKYFKIQNYGVIAASRNLGISKAKGSWIAFLDSDDWWTTDKLIKCVKYLDNNTFDLIYHDLFLVSKPNQSIFKKLAKSRNLNSPVFQDLILNKKQNVMKKLFKISVLLSVFAIALAFNSTPAQAQVETFDLTVKHNINGTSLGLDKELPVDVYVNGGKVFTFSRR